MAGLSLGLKKKLKITACTVDDGKMTPGTDTYEVMINPANLSLTHAVCYNQTASPGAIGSDSKFCKNPPDKVNFEIVIDGTGVVNLPIPGIGSDDVKTQIKALKAIAFDYDGDNHEPNVVQLLWGSFIFYGRLDSLAIDYTLFKPCGDPLRAKVKLAFFGFLSKEEAAKKKDDQSPDMTHFIEVKGSDTLPALCRKIYGDGAYYLDVARINNLVNFRHIRPGTRLRFPPLR